MKRSVVLATTAVTGLGAIALAFTPATGATVKPGAIKFGVPRIVDPIHLYGEPDIKVAPNGTVYVSGPQGTGVQRSIWNASYDNGDSYRLVQDNKTGTAYPSALIPTKSTMGPGGGDTEIAVDRHSNVYYADLYALACFTTAYSRDNGKTVSSTPLGCDAPGADRQWFGIYDPAPADHTISPYKGPKPLIYLKYSDEGASSGSRVDYANGSDPGNWHTDDKATQIASGGGYSPTDAPVAVDQHTGDLLSVVMHGGGMALAIGEPAKDGSAHLNMRYESIAPSTLGGDPNTLFPGFAEDTSRNLYVVWVGGRDYQVYYSYAKPLKNGRDWGAWSAPIKINRPPAAVNLMPWVAAGRNGIIDVVWYGTDMSLAQLGSDGPSAQKNESWWTWFAQIDRANTSKPHIVQSPASQHPMHYNDICMMGTGCITATGNRNIADFFEVTIDNQGRARIVYTDTSNGLSSVLGNVEAADHSGAALVSVATQETGLNAWTGRPLKAAESQAPIAQITDPASDAKYPVLGGTNVPGADIEKIQVARNSKTLRITVTTAHGTLADAAQAARASYGRLVVRWQMGNTLYHAGVDMDASGQTPATFYAGKTQSTDSCSVSACDPHTLDYIAPPLSGAVAATGSVKAGQNTIYTIDVPLSAIGNPSSKSLLEEVAGYVFASPVPGSSPDTKVQSDSDEVPLELEGTKSFNFEAAAAKHGTFAGAILPEVLLLPVLGLATLARRRRRA
ncbi:MAG: hypothetical protein QOG34_708 [Frankiaceae bacterium]|nr:hypothetical protein [Frankiaceae bacterium]